MRIEKGRMDLMIQDLNEEEIEIALSCGLSFNPKTKRWDSQFIHKKFDYFINEEGIITLPLGDIGALELINSNLTLTHNFPKQVYNSINVSDNKLTELRDFPSNVGTDIDISRNKITTLKDLDSLLVVKNFDCSNNLITDLIGCPGVYYDLICSNNPITTFKGMPENLKDSAGFDKNFTLKAFGIRIKNLNHVTKCVFNFNSIYKISNHEEIFVKKRLSLDSTYVETGYVSGMSDLEYYSALASFLIKTKNEDAADEIWWCDEIKPKLKDLFKSLEAVHKFNL